MTAPTRDQVLDGVGSLVDAYTAGVVAPINAELADAQHQLASTTSADAATIAALNDQIVALKAQITAASGGRPTGAGYVTFESLYKTGSSLRSVLADPAIAGRVLTLPGGERFEDKDFIGNGVFTLPASGSCVGLVGTVDPATGAPLTEIGIVAGSSTKGGTVPTASGKTNPLYIVDAAKSQKVTELGGLLFKGNAGHLHGGFQIRNDGGLMHIYKITARDAAPGNGSAPPGETFFQNVWHSAKSLAEDLDYDGAGHAGSLIGYNSASQIVLQRAKATNGRYGMIAFWMCNGVTTIDVQSIGNRVGVNHENVMGAIRHIRPVWQIDRAFNPNQVHMTMHNATYPDNPDVEVHDPIVDTGLKGGCVTVMMGVHYVDANGAKMQQVTVPKVFMGATLLKPCEAGGDPFPPATAHVPTSKDAPDPKVTGPWRFR